MKTKSTPRNFSIWKTNKGQIVLEYLLIMVVVVAVAATLTKTLVARSANEDRQGLIIKAWNRIINVLGYDLADCSKQTDFKSANCP